MTTLPKLTVCLGTALAIGAVALAHPAQAEWNIDLYAGATYENEDSEPGELTVGGRVGYYFPFVDRLDGGLFLDSSGVIDDDKDSTPRDFTFVPTTALALLRFRLVDAADFGLHPYVGVGPSVVWSQLEVGSDDETAVDIGLDARAGLRFLLFNRFALFSEYRLNYFQSDFDLADDAAVHVDDVFHAVIGGLGYHFAAAPAPVAAPAPAPAPQPVAEAPLPPPTKKRIVLRGVTFGFDQAELDDAGKGILDAAVNALQDSPDAEVVVAGHTDAVGSDAYNMTLSQRRATTVRDYLVTQGIDASRLEVRAFGESQPVADNDTAEGRAQNRRVELEVED